MLDDFLRRITKVKAGIEKLGSYTNKFNELYNRKLREVLDGGEKTRITQEIDLVTELFDRQARGLKEELEAIGGENGEVKERCREESLEYQSRNLHWQRCTRGLATEVNRFRMGQMRYAQDEEGKRKALCVALNPGVRDEDLPAAYAELGRGKSAGPDAARGQIAKLEDNNVRIKFLGKRIEELVAMIDDLHRMVHSSAPVVERIEVKMTQSRASTEAANKDLASAYRYQVSAMWLKRILFGVFVAALLAVVLFVVLRFAPRAATRNTAGGGGGNANG